MILGFLMTTISKKWLFFKKLIMLLPGSFLEVVFHRRFSPKIFIFSHTNRHSLEWCTHGLLLCFLFPSPKSPAQPSPAQPIWDLPWRGFKISLGRRYKVLWTKMTSNKLTRGEDFKYKNNQKIDQTCIFEWMAKRNRYISCTNSTNYKYLPFSLVKITHPFWPKILESQSRRIM